MVVPANTSCLYVSPLFLQPMLSLVSPPFPTPQPLASLQHPPALSCPALMLNNCYGPVRELPPWRTFYDDSVFSR